MFVFSDDIIQLGAGGVHCFHWFKNMNTQKSDI